MLLFISAIFMTFEVSQFHRFYPTSQKSMENMTEAVVSITNDTIIVDAKCHAQYGIYTESLDRDRLELGEDFFGIILGQNRNKGYFFMINAKGVKQDGVIVNRSTNKTEWDFVWDINIRTYDDTLWEATFKIPLFQMNFEYKDTLILFMNFVRSAKLEGVGNYEAGTYVPVVGSNFYDLEFTKNFIFGIKNKKKILKASIEPYAALYHEQEGNYFSEGEDVSLKTKAVELAFTANPEYSTVEADVEKFNLNKTQMLYYPEKRPFFMQGFELWSLPFQVLYTRSISDIDAGVKTNVKRGNLSVNTFLLEEKDTASFYISKKRLTGGIRGLYSLKLGELGAFYLRSRDSFQEKGGDVMLYLPFQFRFNTQFTSDRHNKSDIFVHFYRYVRPGVNVEGGFERLDSVDINTAYVPYPVYTRSMWLYLTFNFVQDNKILPYYAIGIGGTHGEYLDGKLYENNATAFATLGLLNNLRAIYNFIPWKRYAEWNDSTYNNLLHYSQIAYQPFKHHYINIEAQFGKYFGGIQKYYSAEYSYKDRNLSVAGGYGYDSEPFYLQKRVYLKAKWNILNNLRLRLFAQHSDISKQDEINFLSEYEIRPGTLFYFVINRGIRHSPEASDTKVMLKFKSFFAL